LDLSSLSRLNIDSSDYSSDTSSIVLDSKSESDDIWDDESSETIIGVVARCPATTSATVAPETRPRHMLL